MIYKKLSFLTSIFYLYPMQLKGTINLFNLSKGINTRTFPSSSIQITVNCPFLARNYRLCKSRVCDAVYCIRWGRRPTRSRAKRAGDEWITRAGREGSQDEWTTRFVTVVGDAGEKLETNRSLLDSPAIGSRQFVFASEEGVLVAC